MCQLYFQNAPAFHWCFCKEANSKKWSDVRYLLELKLGVVTNEMMQTAVIGFLEKDEPETPIFDNYEINENDKIILKRYPLKNKCKHWLPNYVMEKEWYQYTLPLEIKKITDQINSTTNEFNKLNLSMKKVALQFALPKENQSNHPSIKIITEHFKSWRTIEGVEEILIKKNLKCNRCLNICGTHEESKCPSNLKKRLCDLPLPSGVPKTKRKKVSTSGDLSTVKWIDFDGVMWAPC